MKVIQLIQNAEIRVGGEVTEAFKKNKFYLMSDALAQKLRLIIEPAIGIEIPFNDVYNKYTGQDLNGRKIIMMRHGGGGDILFMTTGIKELKRKYPEAKISVAIGEQYISLAENEPEIDKIYHLPICLNDWNEFNYHLIFENLIEQNPLASEYNAYDLFMMQMGFDVKKVPAENKIPQIHLPDQDLPDQNLPGNSDQKLALKHPDIKRVGIQIESSSPIRNYPITKMIPVIEKLQEKGMQVWLFGSQAQRDSILYVAGQLKGLVWNTMDFSIKKSLLYAKRMDYFIAPDSMFIHVAGAFGIPFVGIYGPFHSSVRMKYFKNAVGIDAKVACSPCFKHGHWPCSKGEPSPCFSLITPEIVLKAFEELERIGREEE